MSSISNATHFGIAKGHGMASLKKVIQPLSPIDDPGILQEFPRRAT